MDNKRSACLEAPVVENPHILLVEDQRIAQLSIANSLESWGCTVTSVDTGAEAIEKTNAAFYDLIYMDLNLSDMKGKDITKAIRQNTENFNRYTPIVGITAEANDKIIAACLESGMETVLHKPLHKDDHVAVCETYLGIPLPCVDMKLTLEMASNDKALARDMLHLLNTALDQDMPEIKQAFKQNDGERFYFLLHRIYGGILHVGVPELQLTCKKLEEAYSEQSKDVMGCFENFERASERFQSYYKNKIVC
jgi:CheY-like chemotaxis protein